MPSSDKLNSVIELEREIVRVLCRTQAINSSVPELDIKSRERLVDELRAHDWRDAEHGIVFEAIAKLPGREAAELRRQLPAQATRMGFPDVHWELYFTNESLNASSSSAQSTEMNGPAIEALLSRLRKRSRELAS